jgi:hypothetical protein
MDFSQVSAQMKLQLTTRGRQTIHTGKSPEGRYSVACCDFQPGIEVTGITVDPGGVMAHGKFSVTPTDPLKVLLMAKGEKDPRITGEARFRRYDNGWRLERIRTSSIRW